MALDLFPTLIGQGFIAEKAPIWNTAKAVAASGRERRRQTWSYPRWRFRITFDLLRSQPSGADLNTLFAFYCKVGGSYGEWLFLDPTDNAVTDQAFGVGNGSNKVFQLARTISGGGFLFTEPVRGVYGTPTIKVNGVTNPGWTLDDNGVLTFTTAPANGAVLTWTGQFAFHCRFDQDDLTVQQFMALFWSQSGLRFITVKK